MVALFLANVAAAAAEVSSEVPDFLPDDLVTILVAMIAAAAVIAAPLASAWVAVRQGRKTRDKGTSEHLTNATVVTSVVGELRKEMFYGFGQLHEGLGEVKASATAAQAFSREARDVSRTAAAAASEAASAAAVAAAEAKAAAKVAAEARS